MLTGSVRVRGAWYPSWWRRVLCPTGKNYVTRELIRQLPWTIARIVSNVGHVTVTEGEVRVTTRQTDPCGVNTKDIQINLKVSQRLSAKRDDLLNPIADMASEALDTLCSGKTGRPTVGVDIEFVDTAGFSINTRGARTDSW